MRAHPGPHHLGVVEVHAIGGEPDAPYPGGLGGPQEGTQVAGVFQPIQYQQEGHRATIGRERRPIGEREDADDALAVDRLSGGGQGGGASRLGGGDTRSRASSAAPRSVRPSAASS